MKRICNNICVIAFGICFFLVSDISKAQNFDASATYYECCRPDGHAPLGIMTDHIHGKGQWGISYSYMNMMMKGNNIGATKVDNNTLFENYLMAPSKMTMQMHMLMLMYGISYKLSLMGMVSYSVNSMQMNMLPNTMHMHETNIDHTNLVCNSNVMDSKSSGLGDARLYAMYKIMDKKRQRMILSAGINLPTGSIISKGMTMIDDHGRLPYSMQIGTGTFNLMPSLTYLGQRNLFSWGGMAGANIKMGSNVQGYSWGNEYNLSGWVSYKCCRVLSSSIRVEGIRTDHITGYDKEIAILRNTDPTANSNNFGGQRGNVYLGLNFFKDRCSFKGNRLLLEFGIPVYQNLNGPQMSQQSTLSAGWQYVF